MTNLLSNPGFETNTTGWGPLGTTPIARSTSQAHNSVASCLMARDGTGSKGVQISTSLKPAVNANKQYTFGCWVFAETEASTIVLRMQYYDKAGSGGSATSNSVATGVAIPMGVWTHVQYTTRSDASAAGFVGYAYTASGTNPSNVYYDDFVLVEVGSASLLNVFQLRPIAG